MEKSRPQALEIRNLSFSYGKQAVFDGLSLEVRQGELLGVLGLIGSGKTRLLRLIAGLEEPDTGQIQFHGDASPDRVSFIFQDDLLIPWLSVEENLRLCLRREKKIDLSRAPLTRELGIVPLLPKKPFQLSGGMRKRANFARGFLNADPLILMDEPFTALDPMQKKELQKAFLNLQREMGTTVVFVTHDVREALLSCHRIALLSSKQKRVVHLLENPYQGRFDETALFNEAGYRELYDRILQFYAQEKSGGVS
jgi:ABC-type nitrate/sulfonate/bicarbonate transport system ATPase subunit